MLSNKINKSESISCPYGVANVPATAGHGGSAVAPAMALPAVGPAVRWSVAGPGAGAVIVSARATVRPAEARTFHLLSCSQGPAGPLGLKWQIHA